MNTSFGVQHDFNIHIGEIMTMGQGEIRSVSRKQKLNTSINIENELVAVDDVLVYILWTVLFIEWQGYKIYKNILYQYNKSVILVVNYKSIVVKIIQEMYICYFLITYQVFKRCTDQILSNKLYVGRFDYKDNSRRKV